MSLVLVMYPTFIDNKIFIPKGIKYNFIYDMNCLFNKRIFFSTGSGRNT